MGYLNEPVSCIISCSPEDMVKLCCRMRLRDELVFRLDPPVSSEEFLRINIEVCQHMRSSGRHIVFLGWFPQEIIKGITAFCNLGEGR